MTTIYKKVQKTYESSEWVSSTCDWCKKDMGEEYGEDYPNTREFELKFTKGVCYQDGSAWGEGWEVEDLCDECAGKLQTLLENNGIKTKKVDY